MCKHVPVPLGIVHRLDHGYVPVCSAVNIRIAIAYVSSVVVRL